MCMKIGCDGLPESTEVGHPNEPKALTKQEFGRNLQRLLVERGLNQSELARRAEVGRDSISTYIRGRSFPEPKALAKVARALGVTPQELLPNTIAAAIDSDQPSFEIKESSGNPGKMWMRMNRLVTTKQALQIMQILQNAVEEDKDQQGDIFS